MTRNRLEAFSDGVIAIIITIMVLELRPPEGGHWADLAHEWPKFLAYVLSFIYIAIYWNNHHHLMHTVDSVDGAILWANMHLLFWLSLVPFSTAWLGDHGRDSAPTVLYGISLLMPAIAYTILVRAIIAEQLARSGGKRSTLRDVVGSDAKGYWSLALYLAGIGAAFFSNHLAWLFFAIVAVIWLIPDRRVTRALRD
ncbi:MAG: DUF1211 domain-containing protein [Acidobacteria bacterium]|nr:MAG: DUF1211 domain-containing protein [Acidobacteriota bacterium]